MEVRDRARHEISWDVVDLDSLMAFVFIRDRGVITHLLVHTKTLLQAL